MIKKLSQRIFYLIMASLGMIVLGIIIIFAMLNYKNAINTTSFMMDRFFNSEMKRNINEKPENDRTKIDINIDIKIDGLYYIQIEDSKIIANSDIMHDKTIEEYAIKASQKKAESGIVGKYIYKTRKIKGNTINVTLMENEEAISHIKMIIVFSIITLIVSLIIIYFIAKKVSKVIVKPVQDTFEKQKQFISDASHELKTPLAVIEANADVLENELGNNKWLGYIQNEIESMDKLINELLLLAKIENIDNVKVYKSFDLSKETGFIISMFESMAYEKGIKLNSTIQENIIMNGNKEDIKHVLSTLIDNAIKHTDAQKEVRVEVSKEKNNIIMQVKNMGEPIPKEEREKIFERFYRIDKSRNRKEKRYGLGLAIAKSTVQKYGGKIDVDCRDGVTVFVVCIPV